MNYKNELINLIKSSSAMPSQEAINSDEDIALTVWEAIYHLGNDEDYSGDDSQNILWSSVLANYLQDVNFWAKALSKNTYRKLLSSDLLEIPAVKEALKTKAVEAFTVTAEVYFLQFIDNADIMHKEKLLNSRQYGIGEVLPYSNDLVFMKQFMKKQPELYSKLPDDIKPLYIDMGVLYKDNLPLFAGESKIIEQWFSIHKNKIVPKDLEYLNSEQQKIAFSISPQLMSNALEKDFKFLPIALEVITNDLNSVQYLSKDMLKKIKPFLLRNSTFREKIEQYIMHYQQFTISSIATKLVSLTDNNLKQKLNKNLFYSLSIEEINSLQHFNQVAEQILDSEYTSELCNSLFNLAKSKSTLEVKKTMPHSKNLYAYYLEQKLNANLDFSPQRPKLKI